MWQEILTTALTTLLTIVVPIIVTALAAAAPIIIAWLKNQKIVQRLHLEDLLAAMVPQVVEWVEWWAENLVKEGKAKPASEEKLAKAIELLTAKIPSLGNSDELRMRIETELRAGGFFDADKDEEVVK